MILGKSPRQPIMLNINQIKVEESQKRFYWVSQLIIDYLFRIMLIYRTANYKLHALRRIRKYLTLEKTELQYSAFINSQFNHVSVIWIFCCKKDYLKIEKIQYKALKFIYNSSDLM